ncbi:hypothetical protein GCM10009753_44220 [Streptantibioticus ferralitis]
MSVRIRRAVKARGHFPNEQAALKCVYMAIMSLDPTGKGLARWTSRWKTALNAFDITFDGRLSAVNQQLQPPWSHRSFDRPAARGVALPNLRSRQTKKVFMPGTSDR